ncbi:DNA sulfur modification protein DndD [uncultured Xylophilus sp.]|uniref:DNA sulfur modification protein DndD n=1 Tax=uncultured Xylophilus sp. TaxID=296832 RepID=UPI0025FD2E45|nr:DNA sulfur modification protein DndD [uncultured Xylophilus sp.]
MAKITITTLAIANFGPYREKQEFDLHVKTNKPVILVKALNGSGKTTLLTSLQVGLYGQRAITSGRKSEYESLVRALLRSDADGPHFVEVGISHDTAAERLEYLVRREWVARADGVSEQVTVYTDGAKDFDLSASWDEFIEGVLPAELIQLFFFDGEKIEALANPDRLPDLLRRATEVFLGIGGIDALGNDLKAVERRTAIKNRGESAEFDAARQQLESLEKNVEVLASTVESLRQERGSARNDVDMARLALEKFSRRAERKGKAAYEGAAKIKTAVADANAKLERARKELVDLMSDPVLPTLWIGELWAKYQTQWTGEVQAKQARHLAAEFKKRDARLIKQLAARAPESILQDFKAALVDDMKVYFDGKSERTVGFQDADPELLRWRALEKQAELKDQLLTVMQNQRVADKAEKAVGEIPAKEQMASILSELQEYSKVVSDAETKLGDIERRLAEAELQYANQSVRLQGAESRMDSEFRDKALEGRSLEASRRARQTLVLFKERLLASKAEWLSNMITGAFQELLRKKNLVARVLVDPETYRVSIKDGKNRELPMERLSAGERQLLAIAVLSALIKERKGRFPVVVDTPLARLDQQHRSLLISRFFATVSHQVVVLSTDQEVEGPSHETMRQHTTSEYVLEYDDTERRTEVNRVSIDQVVAKEAT